MLTIMTHFKTKPLQRNVINTFSVAKFVNKNASSNMTADMNPSTTALVV